MKLFILTIIALAFFACSSDESATAVASEKDNKEQSNEDNENSAKTSSTENNNSDIDSSGTNASSIKNNSSSSNINLIADTVDDTTIADVDLVLAEGYYEAKTDNGKFVTLFRDSYFETYTENRIPSLFEGGSYSIKGNKLTLNPDNCQENSSSISCFKTTYIATINTTKDTLVLINATDANSQFIYIAGNF